MAHFAKLDSDNIVTEVIVVNNSELLDDDGVEVEALGQKFVASLGLGDNWVQTSYNNSFRGVFASIGFTYDPKLDVFAPPVVEETEVQGEAE